MYKKKKSITAILLAATLLSASALSGCGSQASVSETTEASTQVSDQAFAEYAGQTVIGSIASIDGNEITLNVMGSMDGDSLDLQGMEMPDGQAPSDGDAPEMPGDGDEVPDNFMEMEDDTLILEEDGSTADSSDEQDSNMPQMPDGQGGDWQEMPDEADGDAPEMPGGQGGSIQQPDGQNGMGQPGGQGGMTGGQNGDAPEMPDGQGDMQQPGSDSNGQSGEVPEKPDGEDGDAPEMPGGQGDMQQPGSDGNGQSGEVPEKPDGEDADAPEMPDGQDGSDWQEIPSDMGDMEMTSLTFTLTDESLLADQDGNALSLSDLEEGDSLMITVDENGSISSIVSGDFAGGMGGGQMGQPGAMGGSGMGQPGGMGGSSGVDSYDAVYEYSENTDLSGETITSTGSDENAVLVSEGAEVTISDSGITRTSSDSTGGDNSSFYGVGAALLVTDGTLTVTDSEITTDSAGGAGVFAYGDGTAYVSDTTITTTQNTSGGIHVAGGGTLYAENLTVETNGESAAAIRSDRGGGTMNVKGGSYTSNGVGSPAVYCTADITIEDAELTATGSEAVCIEGLNTLSLTDCTLTGNMSDSSQNDCTWTVIVYQSMSGDSEVGNGTFSMTGGELISENGGLFYTTNTECTFYLSGVDITTSDDNAFFLQCTGNTNARGWGSSGKNGSQCTFTADDQIMEGNIIYDSISTLDFSMENGSQLTGAIYDDETWAGDGGDGSCSVTIDESSTWIVTADSQVTTLTCSGKIIDSQGKTVTIQGSDGTVYVKGNSSVTVTVEQYNQ